MKSEINVEVSKQGTEILLSARKINKYCIIAGIVFMLPMLIAFDCIHGETAHHTSFGTMFSYMLFGLAANLLLHALFFGIFSPSGFRAITHKWHKGGIITCHCNDTIRLWQYRTACLVPAFLLGFLPLTYGMASGSYVITFIGLFSCLGFIDDLLLLWQLRSFSNNAFINDCSEELKFQISE